MGVFGGAVSVCSLSRWDTQGLTETHLSKDLQEVKAHAIHEFEERIFQGEQQAQEPCRTCLGEVKNRLDDVRGKQMGHMGHIIYGLGVL